MRNAVAQFAKQFKSNLGSGIEFCKNMILVFANTSCSTDLKTLDIIFKIIQTFFIQIGECALTSDTLDPNFVFLGLCPFRELKQFKTYQFIHNCCKKFFTYIYIYIIHD